MPLPNWRFSSIATFNFFIFFLVGGGGGEHRGESGRQFNLLLKDYAECMSSHTLSTLFCR